MEADIMFQLRIVWYDVMADGTEPQLVTSLFFALP